MNYFRKMKKMNHNPNPKGNHTYLFLFGCYFFYTHYYKRNNNHKIQ